MLPAIEVDRLIKRYDGNTAVDEVSFSVAEGEIFAILGPNGAGKTTTVESIAGLRVPDSGHIDVLGFDPLQDRAEVTSRLGVQLQESRFQDRVKVKEIVETFASFYPDPLDGPTLLERLGLGGKADTLYSRLSGGQQQRVSIAVALVGRPRVVILDELTTGLDPQARRETWGLVELPTEAAKLPPTPTIFRHHCSRDPAPYRQRGGVPVGHLRCSVEREPQRVHHGIRLVLVEDP